MWWENDPLQSISKSAEQTKRVENLHNFKSQFIFWSFPNRLQKSLETECREPFDFPTRISRFPRALINN